MNERQVSCYVIDQVCWDADHKKGDRTRLTILAKTSIEAAQLAQDDEMHEIISIQNVGSITTGICNKYLKEE